MIMHRIKKHPYGNNLAWLEFTNINDEESIGSFLIDADNASNIEYELIAEKIVEIFSELRLTYKISSRTVH
jgi:hypothetical protein